MPKVIHYRDKCIGCGVCQQRQPDVWRMSKKDGKAVLLNAKEKKNIFQLSIHSSAAEASMQTAAMCPVNIIKVN